MLAEPNADEAPARDEGEGTLARGAHWPSGARSRLPVRLRPRNPLEAGREDSVEEVALARIATDQRVGRQDQPVADDGTEQALDVLGDHVIAPVDERPGARHALEREAAAHGRADLDRVVAARAPNELDRPLLQQRVDVDLLDRGEHVGELADADDRAEVVERMPVELCLDDRELLIERRVAERGADQEAVELRLGQRERSLLLDRVLGRDDEERVGQRVRDAVDRDLMLRHALEQGRLRLRQRPVHLVDDEDVGEDRPGPELELPRVRVPHRQPGDVRGLEVGRALDPRDGRALDRPGQRAGEHRLRRTGYVLEEHVALAGERGDDQAGSARPFPATTVPMFATSRAATRPPP